MNDDGGGHSRGRRSWQRVLVVVIILGAALFTMLELANGDIVVSLIVIGLLLILGLVLWLADEEQGWGDLGQALILSALFGLAFAFYNGQVTKREARQSFEFEIGLQRDLSGSDLEGKDLSGKNLAGKDFSGANLSGALLNGANLTEADLSQADLDDVELNGATLIDADLRGASLEGVELGGAKLTRARLSDAHLTDADLGGATLVAARLRDSCLAGANLERARLFGATFHGANLNGADLGGAVLERDLRPAVLVSETTDDGGYVPGASLARTSGHPLRPWPPGYPPPTRRRRPGPEPRPQTRVRTGVVTKVSDGDTIRISGLGAAKFADVDAPPPGASYGDEAAAFVGRELAGRRVSYAFADDRRDQFGRALPFVWSGRQLFNQTLLLHGLAAVADDVGGSAYRASLLRAEEVARDAGRKIWRECPEI